MALYFLIILKALISGKTVQSSNYWSATTYAYITDFALRVNMNDGTVFFGSKTSLYYVWPVHDGQ